MPLFETEGGRCGDVLAGRLAPLRLPERVGEALESLAEAARELGAMRAELVRVREQTEPLADLKPTTDRIREQAEVIPDLLAVSERIREQAEPVAGLLTGLERLDSLHEVVVAVEDVESASTRPLTALGESWLRCMRRSVAFRVMSSASQTGCPTRTVPGRSRRPARRSRAVAAIDAARRSRTVACPRE